MDNLGSHKRAAINKAIRAKGARRFFPPQYSPDLNPIEQVFAKLKKLLRKAEERTPEGVWRRIGTDIHQIGATVDGACNAAARDKRTPPSASRWTKADAKAKQSRPIRQTELVD
jgi:hypothetical protein